MGYNNQITFGELTLSIDRLTARKVDTTIKQIIGKRLIIKDSPGATTQDWSITIEGRHIDANRHTDRATLESYDDLKKHKLTDGIHDGDYFITALSYDDSVEKPCSYSFRLSLLQNQ